ncbi:MAG: xanthine dehydrogenase family protein molybdopterin-binding subunit, partial [Rhodospirillales bacterium]|nr:xanthine dehydrogenase family protein molybdopterin-binding subunit [Rhodospirillales bacterium]
HTLVSQGVVNNREAQSKHQIEGLFETSFAAHAAMEPRAAIVSVKKENAEVWCGSQDPFFVQRRVAKAIGRSASSVIVHPHRMGGAFGGRVPCQASEEAALLSQAVGAPVRIEWDRETEFAYNYFQPRFSHFIKAGITDEGQIDHWQHDFVSSPIITGLVPGNIAWIMDKVVADKGTARGSLLPYNINNQRVRYSDIRTPVSVGAWRGLGSAPNTFAIESMIDQLADTANIDPLSFRLKNLTSTQYRLAGVLKRVAKLAKWGSTSPVNIGRGIACAIYKNETYVAIIAEVEMDVAIKDLSIRKIYCVHDSGLVINPDQVENQIVGNIVWGCSMVLKEQITFAEGMVKQRNFDDYEFLRHSETPQMIIDLVKSDAPPTAVGESAFGPVAPAITNAIFAATGIRVSRLPMNFEN